MTTHTLQRGGAAVFNLIDEPWIPVLDLHGREREVSLREALISAHEHRDIVGELPTMRFALFRILLSVAYRALDRVPVDSPTEEWGELWRQPQLPSAGFERYFEEWRHRFDLVDADHPFMQTPELRTAKQEWKPVSLIVADADPEGALFTMRSELDSLSLSEAARWLVHAHAYDYAGIKSGAVGDSRVKNGKGFPMGLGWAGWLGGILLGGKDLRETLLLNLIIGRTVGRSGDLPIWERSALTPAERTDEEIGTIGPLALMSWPQRRIRLRVERDRVTGVLVSNGDELGYTVRLHDEPMTGWRFSEPQSAKAKAPRFMPRKLEPGRSLWRGLSTLIPTPQSAAPSASALKKWPDIQRTAEPAETLEWLGNLVEDRELSADTVIEVSAVSMEYGTQNASFSEVVSDRLSFAAALADLNQGAALLSLAQTASARAESAVRSLQRLAANLDRAAGGDGEAVGRRVGDEAYVVFDFKFREWLLEVKPECDAVALLAQWTEDVRRIVRDRAERLAEEAPASAWIGRPNEQGGQVLSVATAMRWFENSLFRALGASPTRDDVGGAQQNMEANEGVQETETAK